ncbi:hypothetical protein LJR219_001120 [Phenylobacterium sp. LjRoot219]|uniref:hypothetical protein n=1 Tax=Phenylobacterium sp. LjRoot219 TaxID=3342283 RepID=UPI003ECEEF32
MSTSILVNALFYLIGGGVFAAIGWLINHAAATRSLGMRLSAAAGTSLLPLILPLAAGIGPALQYGHYASQDPRLPLLILAVAPLVAPAALGSLLGARRPVETPTMP